MTDKNDEADDGTDAESDDYQSSSPADGASGAHGSSASAKLEEGEQLSEFLEAVRTPISEEAPTGESILYDESFRTLKSQIDAIGSASGAANYEEIVELAEFILTEQSKDLRVAGYLVLGNARLNGAKGLATGLHALRLLIEDYWEDLYPEYSRMRGRGNALQFVGDRLPDWLQDASFEPVDRESLVSALEDLDDIQQFSLEEMEEHAPSLSGLKSDLEDVISNLPKPDPEPDSSSETEDPGDSEETASQRESSNQTDGSPRAPSEISSATDATQTVRTSARFVRENDPTSPLSYRLLRTIRWGELRTVPPNENGTTRFEPPRAQRREYLEGLLEDGKYETLVREGEDSFQEGSFHVWLDLQRLVAEALKALGQSYEEAHRTVVLDLAVLLRRVPDLKSLSFADDTPFASPLTLDWIQSEVEPSLSDTEREAVSSEGATSGLERLDELYEEARKELTGGRLDAALSIMRDWRPSAPSSKEGFYQRFYVACLCVKGREPEIARPLLDQLDTVIKAHSLNQWVPSLAVDVWQTQCQCYDQLLTAAGGEEANRVQSDLTAVYEKICRTSPEVAAQMTDYSTLR